MARLRSLTARPGAGRTAGIAALVAALLLPAGFGCSSLKQTKSDFAQALHLEKPHPASQMICFWQRRPQHLPDPSRDGIMSPGLVGQLFLISPDNKPVEITGDLVVQALDETPRPKGQPSAVPEIWHIDKAALKKLVTNDDRFGPCYAIFLPWPQSWKDVSVVRMQAKYISKPNPDLFASDVQMTLEFAAPGAAVWNEKGGISSPVKPTGPSEMRGIPDLTKALKNQQMGMNPPAFAASNPTVAPPNDFLPPQPPGPIGLPGEYSTVGPNGSVVNTKVWTSPPPTVKPPPLQQSNYGQAQPMHQPAYNQPQSLHLPPAIPTPDAGQPWGTLPAPNLGLPEVNIPVPGSLQPVVIPRY